jgi:hypothetical protein
MTWTETPVPPNPWVSTAGVPPSTWTPATPCGVTVKVTIQQKTQTLYYIADSGQTLFSLSAADMFDNNVLLDGSQALVVSKGGLRLVPDDGSGVGGYTVDFSNNTITLLWPAGDGEILVVDLFQVGDSGVEILNQFLAQEALIVTAPNTLSNLSWVPDGSVFTLTVDGRPFSSISPDPAFTYNGTAVTWISTLYSLNPGDEVIAAYTSGGASVPPTPVPPTGIPDAPMDNYPYARYMATWERLPQAYIPEAPNTGQRFGRFNSTWQLDAIQTDAASDGNAYGRVNNAWSTVLATTGGTITGSLTVNQVLTVQGSNSLVLNAPNGNQRAILGQTSTLTRWQLQLGDGTSEGLNNTGSNFALTAYATAGGYLGNWLTIARADGSTTFNGSGVTIAGGLAVNGLLALAGTSNLAIYGGSAGQVLSTNGSGILSWATPTGGGITDAPNDGTAYARKSAAWAHLAHTDITDWTATLAPYALTSAVPVASTTTPTMNGTAAVGTGTTWARADHVHPSDTSRYAATNPSGYQTAAQVTASLGSYMPLAGGAFSGGVSFGSTVAPGGVTDLSRHIALFGAAGYGFSVTSGRLNILGGTIAFNSGSVDVATFVNGSATFLSTASFSFNLQKAASGNAIGLFAYTGATSVAANLRWQLLPSNGNAESGSNAGSNFEIRNYSDTGVQLASPLLITRSTGVATFSAAIVNGPSDRTLKENITPIDDALGKVLELKGVSFNMIGDEDKRRQIGLIAQDVAPVVPEILQEFNAGEDAEPKLALDYPKLTALLIEAVKTLTARVAVLEAK